MHPRGKPSGTDGVGIPVGTAVGEEDGTDVGGSVDGWDVGGAVGSPVGCGVVGDLLGTCVGDSVGGVVGVRVGVRVGTRVGMRVGRRVGLRVRRRRSNTKRLSTCGSGDDSRKPLTTTTPSHGEEWRGGAASGVRMAVVPATRDSAIMPIPTGVAPQHCAGPNGSCEWLLCSVVVLQVTPTTAATASKKFILRERTVPFTGLIPQS